MATGQIPDAHELTISEPISSQFEKIPVQVFGQAIDASKEIASRIADRIKFRAAKDENCVLGLATGSTPVSVYAELVR